MSVQEWPCLASEPLHEYRVFRTRQDKRRSPRTGREHTFFVIESPDWVNIVPLTAVDNITMVVMIEQFRHGSGEITLEVPGGMVDAGEEPSAAGSRELREETGYAPTEVQPLGHVSPNPALFNNICYSFVALNCHKVEEPQFDGSEDIQVRLVPLADIPALIQQGKITHSLTINALYFLEMWERGVVSAEC